MIDFGKKPEKVACEVCGEKDKNVLDLHHIIPRTEPECTNSGMNLAVLCSTCHRKVHLGNLKILGVYPSTSKTGRTLVYELDGVKNLDIEPYHFKPKPKQTKVNL